MKIKFINGLIIFLVTMTCCQSNQDFIKVSRSEIDQDRLLFATQLSDKIMTTLKIGGFYQLTEKEAISIMVKGFTEILQRQAYEQVKGLFGEYKGLVFDHLLKTTDGTLYKIYRFRGQFESTEAKVEIRAVLNSQGKLAGFFIKPWMDELK